MTDLQAKYQKLATEYSKLRAQVPVLKKAVLDEQAKHEELKETIKERDQAVRQYEQEADSLMFRNRQLSTRVSLLQEELDRSDVKHGKHKQDKRSAVHPPELSAGDTVLGEELKSKIEENARLHRQVFESVERHQQSENELQEKVRQLSEEVSQQKQLLVHTEQEYTQRLDTLQSQRAQMEVQLQQQEKQLKDAQQKVKTLMTQVRKSPPSNSISEKTTTFNETPRQDRVVGALSPQHWSGTTTEMAPLVASLTRCLVSLYTHGRQRWSAHTPEGGCQPLSDVSSMKKADNLEDFAETLKSCVNNITQLLPHQVHSIDEECRTSTCTESLGVKNRQLQTSLKTFSSSLGHLQTYLSLLTAQSGGSHGNQATQNMDKLLVMLVQAGADFHKVTTDLSKQFSVKVSLERQLSTATQKWKETDDHIMSTLDSLVTCSSQLAVCLKDNLSVLRELPSDDGRSGQTKLGALSGDVVENGQAEFTSVLSTDRLALQVATLQDRLCNLEQDKEKWKLEIELQQMKYEKLLQKAARLEETLQKMDLSSDTMTTTLTTTSPSPTATNQASTKKCTVSTSLIGKLEIESCEEESEMREELIKQYFSRRLAEVTTNLQTADSKALHLHTECCALHGRLRLTLKDKEKLQEELSLAKELVVQVKDELQTMTDGYKSQLSTMSEHLAGMNEKLTAQKDEIDMLKYQLHNVTTNKKGRGK